MADKIKGITVQIGGDTSGLSKALSGINKEIRGTQGNLKEVEKLLKLDPTSTTLLKEKQELLAKQIKNTKKELDALKQAQQQAKEMLANGEIGQSQYDELANKIEYAERKLESLENEAADTAKKIGPSAEKIGQAFTSAGDKIEAAGKKLAPFSALAAAGLGAGVKAASDWESAFAGVRKTVDATEEDYEKLGAGIQGLATRTASSAEDIAAVAEAAGQLGVNKDDIMEFVETMINLGDSTNVSAADAAVSLARFTTVTGSSQKDVRKLGSAIVDLGNNFATDEASIISMSQRLAAAGRIAGLSETDILALATSMSSVGIEAEAGGTAMTQTLTGIEKIISDTSEKGKKKLNTLAKVAGMSSGEFAKAWKKEPIKAVQAFIAGLGKLDEQGESSTAVLDDLGMSGVRQSNMLKSLGLASETLANAVEVSSKAYSENNALTNEANKRYSTFESQVSQTKESLKQVAVEIGQIVIPIIKDLMDGVKDVVGWFKNLDEGTKKTIVTVMGITAALSPVLITIGKLTKGIGTAVQGFSKLGTAMKGMGGVGALAVAGIAAVVAAVASHKKQLQEIREEHRKLSDSEQALKDKIDDEAKAWEDSISAMADAEKAAGDQAKTNKELWNQLKNLVDAQGNVKKGYEEEAEYIAGQLADALGIEIDLVDGQIKNYKELAKNINTIIEKKKAEAILTATQGQYTDALMKQTEAAKDLSKAEAAVIAQEEKVAKQQTKVEEVQKRLNNARRDGNDETGAMAATINALEQELQKEQAALEGDKNKLTLLNQMRQNAEKVLTKYDATVKNHDALQKAVATGSTKQMENAIKNLTTGFITAESGTTKALASQTMSFMREYGRQLEIVKKTGSETAKAGAQEAASLVSKSIAELEKLDPKLAAEMKKHLKTINASAPGWKAAGESTAKNYVSGINNSMGGINVTPKVKEALDLTTNAKVWGADMMKNYATSIDGNSWRLTEAAKAAAKKVVRVLGFSEPEEGPLSDFHTYGPDMMELYAQGIKDSQWQVIQAAQGVAASLKSTLEGTMLTAQLDKTSVPLGGGVTLNISNFNNYSDSDIRELTNEIMETAAAFAARKGAVFA